MVLMTFMAAVAMALAFQRQEKKHRLELSEAYHRAGLELPPPVPLIEKDEAWASIGLGVLLCLAGAGIAYTSYITWRDAGLNIQMTLPALLVGCGGALIYSARKAGESARIAVHPSPLKKPIPGSV
jgi:hypothetical protein